MRGALGLLARAARLRGQRAHAAAEEGDQLLRAGRELQVVAAGLAPAERVVLDRGGVRETLALPARGNGAPAEAKHAG